MYEWMGQPEKARADYQQALEKQEPPLTPLKQERAKARLRALRPDEHKILFLAADPTDATRLRLEVEYEAINDHLEKRHKLGQAKLDQVDMVLYRFSWRINDLSRVLLTKKPQIVHFSGHDTVEGGLCFENAARQTQVVEPEALAALFEQFKYQVECVVLSACYAKAQARAIAKHIDYVIGMNDAIGQEAALAFTLGFYQAIGAGKGIEEAFSLGCIQIRLETIPEYLTPVLIKKKQTLPYPPRLR